MDEYANLEAEVLQEMEEEEARNNELRKIHNMTRATVSCLLHLMVGYIMMADYILFINKKKYQFVL